MDFAIGQKGEPMSRLNDLQEAIANQNSEGGISSDKWVVLLLTHIALSLATIADTMTREDGEANADVES